MTGQWTPKAGDRVMVGEHGPYKVRYVNPKRRTAALHEPIPADSWFVGEVPTLWMTPAPDPEPGEPTAPGALVRDGRGDLICRDGDGDWSYVTGRPKCYDAWRNLTRPVTVVLADPAEVETLREQMRAVAQEAQRFHRERDHARAERDELRRRIGVATAYAYEQQAKGEFISSSRIDAILRADQ